MWLLECPEPTYSQKCPPTSPRSQLKCVEDTGEPGCVLGTAHYRLLSLVRWASIWLPLLVWKLGTEDFCVLPKVTRLIKWQSLALGLAAWLPCPYSEPYTVLVWCLVIWGPLFFPGGKGTGHITPMRLPGLSDWGYQGGMEGYMAGEVEVPEGS